jgi:hypothetical protein
MEQLVMLPLRVRMRMSLVLELPVGFTNMAPKPGKKVSMAMSFEHLASELVMLSDAQLYARALGIRLDHPAVVKLNTLRTKSLRTTADICLEVMKNAGMHWTDLEFLDEELTKKFNLTKRGL